MLDLDTDDGLAAGELLLAVGDYLLELVVEIGEKVELFYGLLLFVLLLLLGDL